MEPALRAGKKIPRESKRQIERRIQEARREIISRTVTVISTAVALVAALFWQTAITDTIKTFIPVSGVWQYEIGVALVITFFAAVTVYFLNRGIPGSR